MGDKLSLWYNAAETDDYADFYGLIFNDANGNETWDGEEPWQMLFHEIGPTTGGWINLTTSLELEGKDLRFWFINGSYDNSGGNKVGSYLSIDDIILTCENTQLVTNQIVEKHH